MKSFSHENVEYTKSWTYNSIMMNFIQTFFKKSLDICPFMGPLVPLFWTSGDVSPGFQSHSGKPY